VSAADPEGATAYPISGVTFLLLAKSYPAAKAGAKDFAVSLAKRTGGAGTHALLGAAVTTYHMVQYSMPDVAQAPGSSGDDCRTTNYPNTKFPPHRAYSPPPPQTYALSPAGQAAGAALSYASIPTAVLARASKDVAAIKTA
jgi:hypothetical protein